MRKSRGMRKMCYVPMEGTESVLCKSIHILNKEIKKEMQNRYDYTFGRQEIENMISGKRNFYILNTLFTCIGQLILFT